MGTCSFQGSGILSVNAETSGNANIVKRGALVLQFYNNNLFTGTVTANGSRYIHASQPLSLGTTNAGITLNGTTCLLLGYNMAITNEALTVNSSQAMESTWRPSGPPVRGTDR